MGALLCTLIILLVPFFARTDAQVWGFETLTSEQKLEGEDKSDLLYRKRGRVYPEVGCALDNLSL